MRPLINFTAPIYTPRMHLDALVAEFDAPRNPLLHQAVTDGRGRFSSDEIRRHTSRHLLKTELRRPLDDVTAKRAHSELAPYVDDAWHTIIDEKPTRLSPPEARYILDRYAQAQLALHRAEQDRSYLPLARRNASLKRLERLLEAMEEVRPNVDAVPELAATLHDHAVQVVVKSGRELHELKGCTIRNAAEDAEHRALRQRRHEVERKALAFVDAYAPSATPQAARLRADAENERARARRLFRGAPSRPDREIQAAPTAAPVRACESPAVAAADAPAPNRVKKTLGAKVKSAFAKLGARAARPLTQARAVFRTGRRNDG